MKRTLTAFALIIFLASVMASAGSCKGDPAKFSRMDINMADTLASAPSSMLTVMTMNFEPMARDTEIGAKYREQMAEANPELMRSIPLWDFIDYIHGMALYSPSIFGPRPMMTGIAILLFVEMDRSGAEKYMSGAFQKSEVAGRPVYTLDNEMLGQMAPLWAAPGDNFLITILSDNEVLFGDGKTVTEMLEARTTAGAATGNSLIVPASSGSIISISIKMSRLVDKMIESMGGTDSSPEQREQMEDFRKIELLQSVVSIEGDTCVAEAVMKAPGLGREDLDKYSRQMFESFSFGLSGETEPETVYEPWGIRVRSVVPKSGLLDKLNMRM